MGADERNNGSLIKDGKIVLTYVKREKICGYGASGLKKYDWERNKEILEGEEFGETFGQWLFGSESLGARKEVISSVLVVKPEERGVAVVQFLKIFLLSWLKFRRGGAERDSVLVEFKEVAMNSDMFE